MKTRFITASVVATGSILLAAPAAAQETYPNVEEGETFPTERTYPEQGATPGQGTAPGQETSPGEQTYPPADSIPEQRTFPEDQPLQEQDTYPEGQSYEPAPTSPDYRMELGSGFDEEGFQTYDEGPNDGRPDLVTDIGLALTVGGGVGGFVEEVARDFTDPAGVWDARFTFGTRSYVGGEVGYIGYAGNIQALGLDNDASLLGNGAEAAARLNFATGMWQPYVLAGAGWTHYRLINDEFNTSNVAETDNIVHFPLGAGLGFRYEGLLVDLRGIFRPSVEGDLFEEDGNDMHTWGANASAGVEF